MLERLGKLMEVGDRFRAGGDSESSKVYGFSSLFNTV